MSHASRDDEFTELSDHDIEVLFCIIERTYSVPEPSFGQGLFAAYDAIVAEQNVPKEDADVYFRFLVRMVAGRADTDTPATRFKSLLASQGIQVQFDIDETRLDDITRHSSVDESHKDEDDVSARPSVRASQQQSRRSSVGSIYEASSWKTGENLYEALDVHERPLSRASDPTGAPSHSNVGRRLLERFSDRGRVSNRAVSDNLYYQRKSQNTSNSGLDSFPAPRRAESDTGVPSRANSVPPHGRALPPVAVFHPSDTQLLADADTFAYHRNVRLLRRVLWQWRDLARPRAERAQRMDRLAQDFERQSAARKASRLFSSLVQVFQADKAREQAFMIQEVQIDRERDFHLKEKAFDHWYIYAQEHVQRTAVARRHILRTKYFNAWKNHTALTELKVRHHRLKKFFGTWKRRFELVELNEYLAHDSHRAFLVRTAWLKLGREALERKASAVAEDRYKRIYFNKWALVTSQRKQVELDADDFIAVRRQKRILTQLQSRLELVRRQQIEADNFRQRGLLSGSLFMLAAQARLAPPYRRTSGAVDSRLALTALRTWNLRTCQSLQAAEVHRQRILRNAFTLWDDRLRCSWLARRIDDRVAVEALYKLSIASKASMFARVADYKLVSRCFDQLSLRVRSHASELELAAAQFESTQRRILLRGGWNRFRATYNSHKYDEARAAEQYRSNTAPNIFQEWRTRTTSIQKMNEEASIARFYILTTRSLKQWRQATEQSQKIKRREAYTAIRRRCKVNLVRQTLGQWLRRTETVQRMEQQATRKAEDRALAAASAAFRLWYDRTAEISQMSQRAASQRKTVLVRTSLAALLARHDQLLQLGAKIQPYRHELAVVAAQKAFSKLRWRLFELRTRNQTASALKEKHWESRVKSMLRFWAEQAANSRLQRATITPGVGFGLDTDMNRDDDDGNGAGTGALAVPKPVDSRSSATLNEPEDEGPYDTHIPSDASMLRAEEWTALDDSNFDIGQLRFNLELLPPGTTAEAEGIITSTPMPGYLRTPSKRSAARSKVRERMLAMSERRRFDTPGDVSASDPSTLLGHGAAGTAPAAVAARSSRVAPASSPLVTPFERRLWAQGIHARGSGSSVGVGANRTPGYVRVAGGGFPQGTGRGRGNTSFAGFDDIPEDDRSREDS